MDKDQDIAFKTLIFAQAFVDCMEELKGSSFYKHQLKNRGNSFIAEVES